MCQCHAILCTISNTTNGPNSKLNLTAIGIFTLYALIDSCILGRSIVYIKRSQVIISKQIIFLSLKIFCVLANGEDPDEIPHSVAFHEFSLFVKVRI